MLSDGYFCLKLIKRLCKTSANLRTGEAPAQRPAKQQQRRESVATEAYPESEYNVPLDSHAGEWCQPFSTAKMWRPQSSKTCRHGYALNKEILTVGNWGHLLA